MSQYLYALNFSSSINNVATASGYTIDKSYATAFKECSESSSNVYYRFELNDDPYRLVIPSDGYSCLIGDYIIASDNDFDVKLANPVTHSDSSMSYEYSSVIRNPLLQISRKSESSKLSISQIRCLNQNKPCKLQIYPLVNANNEFKSTKSLLSIIDSSENEYTLSYTEKIDSEDASLLVISKDKMKFSFNNKYNLHSNDSMIGKVRRIQLNAGDENTIIKAQRIQSSNNEWFFPAGSYEIPQNGGLYSLLDLQDAVSEETTNTTTTSDFTTTTTMYDTETTTTTAIQPDFTTTTTIIDTEITTTTTTEFSPEPTVDIPTPTPDMSYSRTPNKRLPQDIIIGIVSTSVLVTMFVLVLVFIFYKPKPKNIELEASTTTTQSLIT